jgi:hypothetical protein
VVDSPRCLRNSGSAMVSRVSGRRQSFVLLAIVLALAIVAPLPAFAAGTRTSVGAFPAEAKGTYTLDLSARGDFVAQTTFVQCVGASMQMMLNMIRAKDDRTTRTQRSLQVLARTLSGSRPDGSQRKGASVRGWTSGLNSLSAGPYRTVGEPTLQGAIKLAASAMRRTGRPVGLLVWRGRHAWVMAGFRATADPAVTDDFKVLHVIVMDPLYPYGSKVWGPSPRPREALSVSMLGRQFVPRSSRNFQPGGGQVSTSAWAQSLNGQYVIVMPYTPVTVPLRHRA